MCYVRKLATKTGNLELKMDMENVCQAKVVKITRNTTQIKNKIGFFLLDMYYVQYALRTVT